MKTLLLSLGAALLSFGQTQAENLPPKEKLKIYLLMGQSNMAGAAPLTEEDKTPHSRIFNFTRNNQWELATEPLHARSEKGRMGPGFAFAKELVATNKEIAIGLVPCAVGGTPLQRWQRGGDLYSNAVTRAKAAAKSGELAGVLWHQGEADSKTNSTAATYRDRLEKMIADFRADVNAPQLPFVAGQIGQFTYTHKANRFPFARIVNEALLKIPESVALTACVTSDDLSHTGDEVHFDNKSQRELGRRYAVEMQKLQAKAVRKN